MSEPLSRDEALDRHPNLRGADLRGADLRDADLRDADLRWANLCGADLHGASLHKTNLYKTNLYGADLREANLYKANLYGADLYGVKWDGLAVDGLHRYRCLLIPTCDGWVARIGCWTGTVDQLQTLIEGDDWPESDAEQRAYLRPRLQTWIDMCRLHIDQHPHTITDLAERWGSDE